MSLHRLRLLSTKTKIGLAGAGIVGVSWCASRAMHNASVDDDDLTPRGPDANVEESLIGNEAAYFRKKPFLFEWSSIPKFIEKRYDPSWQGNGPLWNVGSTLTVGLVGTVSKVFLTYLADTRVYNLEKFQEWVTKERSRGLLTVSNHESVLDDPVLWGVLDLVTLFDIDKMRWVLGAADICFTSLFKSIFFAFGQTIPTIRGSGIYQPGVDFAIHKTNQNGWIHIFPEARVNQTASMIRFKWGVGRIIMESERCPIVIPMWHNGMAEVRPLKGPPIRFFKPITVAFGEPIDFQDTLDAWRNGELSETEARIKITSTLFHALAALKKKTEDMMETTLSSSSQP